MIPLLLFCVFGGCLDQPVDTRPIFTQIYEDQINVERTPFEDECDEDFYTGRRDPRNRDC